jgi:hypothetical protein
MLLNAQSQPLDPDQRDDGIDEIKVILALILFDKGELKHPKGSEARFPAKREAPMWGAE